MKEKLLIIGSGGHAKVIIDMLLENNQYEIVGCIDNYENRSVFGINVVGKDEDLEKFLKQGVNNVFIAIGNNCVRKKIYDYVTNLGYNVINVVSKDARISKFVSFGKGIAIMPGAVINADTFIGNGVIVNTGATIDHDCKIGDFVHVAPGSNLAGKVVISEGSFLGVGTKIIDGINVGKWTIIGAGSVIINDIEDNVTVVGVPGKIIKRNEWR